MKEDSLGDRMKGLENVLRTKISKDQPTIIRIDGKSFSNYTRPFEKPFDDRLYRAFVECAQFLLEQIQAADVVYTQSDELSILLNFNLQENSQTWFDGNLQKLTSVSASMMTYKFNNVIVGNDAPAYFDARAFALPRNEVSNYFIWRYLDAVRNSVQGYARSILGHKKCLDISNQALLQILRDQNEPWEKLPEWCRYGTFVYPNGEILHANDLDSIRKIIDDTTMIKEVVS